MYIYRDYSFKDNWFYIIIFGKNQDNWKANVSTNFPQFSIFLVFFAIIRKLVG